MKNYIKTGAELLFILALIGLPALASGRPGNSAASIDLHFTLLPEGVIAMRLRSAPRSNPLREASVHKMFIRAGCPTAEISQQSVNPGQPANLICTLPGVEPSEIIVGGHLDKVRRGNGVVDDWSGSSLLPSLYASLHASERKHTFLFIAFTEEEKGLVGSKFYVRHLPSVKEIRAMVNLECLGMNPVEVWQDHAAPSLLNRLYKVSGSLHKIIPSVDLEGVGRDDAMSFRNPKVATITLHSLTQKTVPVLHSKRDNLSAENIKDSCASYKIIAAYLAYLDQSLP